MHILSKFAGLVIAAAALGGCASQLPIMNVDAAATTNAAGKTLTNDQVRAAIIRAGAALGWQMKDEGSNKVVGTLILRTHTAVVEIPYNTTSYSIKYRSSINLDEKGGTIHKNYNGWISNLTKGINTQLSLS